MSNNFLKDELEQLLVEVVKDLRERIREGTAKPADVANAIKLLQANGINILRTGDKAGLQKLAEELVPFPTDDDE